MARVRKWLVERTHAHVRLCLFGVQSTHPVVEVQYLRTPTALSQKKHLRDSTRDKAVTVRLNSFRTVQQTRTARTPAARHDGGVQRTVERRSQVKQCAD